MSFKKSQVWVETVIYTLIALTVIGLFLSFAKPKIEEVQDKAIVEQSIEMLESINSIILDITQSGPGNQRSIEIGLKKGSINISSIDDTVFFEAEGRYAYTEPGSNVNVGSIVSYTEKKGNLYRVKLISNYSNVYNITYNGGEENGIVQKSSVPYKILISNKGTSGNLVNIDFSIV